MRQTRRAAGWLGPWIALTALALWAASPGYAPLLLAAGGMTSAALWGPRGRGWPWGAGSAILILAILVGFVSHRQVRSAIADWDGYWASLETDLEARLDDALEDLLVTGEAAADSLLTLALALPQDSLSQSRVHALRAWSGVEALALYDESSALVAWDGVHRGRVPEEAQTGALAYMYRDLPLFGYLYVTAASASGHVAVAAHLLRTDVSPALGADLGDFETEFTRETGEAVRVRAESPRQIDGVFDLMAGDGTRLLSVVAERPGPSERVAAMMERWRGFVSVLVVLSWVLLAIGGPPRVAAGTVAAGALILVAGFLPFGQIDRLAPLFDAATFTLPGPFPVSLGRFTLLIIAGFTTIGVLPRPQLRVRPWMAGAAVGLAFPLLLGWASAGLHPFTLSQARLDFVVYATGLAGLLTLAAGSAMASTRTNPDAGTTPAAVGVVAALLLSAAAGGFVVLTREMPSWLPVLWGVPAGAIAMSMGAWPGWQRPLVGWTTSVLLASGVAIPHAWEARIEARIHDGSETLTSLAAPSVPELERGLLRLAALADSLQREGYSSVDVMYGAWRGSGLAERPYPLRLSIWHGEDPPEELRIGVGAERPGFVDMKARMAMTSAPGTRIERLDQDDGRYIISRNLADGGVFTAVAPPQLLDPERSPLSALMGAAERARPSPITLIPLILGDPRGSESLEWVRTEAGWQGEIALRYDNGTYHAHLVVDIPGAVLATARGSLLFVLNLLLFFPFWLGGRALLRDVGPPDMRLSGLVISFRARVTLALFGFFLLANAIFGTLAYRTLAQASARSAQVIAERVVEDAAGWYLSLEAETGTRMERLARQVRAELLEYRDGELRGGGSVAELVELGLYEGWMPMDLHLRLNGREGVREFTETSLGRWRYVTAYRRLPDGDILGAQVPLQAGTTAIQTGDLIELMGFALLVGAALSLALAWMAGRALTSPIRALQTASEGVGGGNLALRLPDERTDEFGAVFRAFNRMVGRLRRARRQLVRTSRRTQAIMDEAAVGMIALDPGGRVLLVNPSAEELLETEVFVGREVPTEGVLADALAEWVDTFLEDPSEEAATELHGGERRIRVRARRLGSFGTRRGVVVAMDDVTDELRTERVLAWGEMARQVAHEVKNPLTPIKLSIQHIRRAWQDGRTDFDEILVKNADAMLAEIDRLAEIAQSFSRFGAPGSHAETPLEAVAVSTVVDDVMALYKGGAEPLASFEQRIPHDLPPVRARTAELKEALINLLENSRAAIDEGGVVRIEARLAQDGAVVVSVVDDGSGIPAESLPRIFEPQFSTRSGGAGLGLPIVRRLVDSWGGQVRVQSTHGEGTSVSLHVARWTDAAD